MSEIEKFKAWLEQERDNGLVDVKFDADPETWNKTTETERCAAFNSMIEASTVEDLDDL